MTTQPKALRLASMIEYTDPAISDELRRLYAMNAALIGALLQAEQLLEYGQSNEALSIISDAIDKTE